MTKTELMETYAAEQLAEMAIKANNLADMLKYSDSFLKSGLFDNLAVSAYETKLSIMQHENDKLKSEAEKYRKAFEDAKNERDCQIAEYQKKIEKLTAENSELHCELQAVNAFQEGYPTEPIKVADMLINAEGEYEHNPIAKALYKEDKGTYRIFDIGELRQIAEHLLVYCNHNGEVEE